MPTSLLKSWTAAREAFLQDHPGPDWSDDIWQAYHQEITQQMEGFLDAGHGACVLAQPELRELVVSAFHHFDNVRYDLGSYVIMPNHVHILLTPKNDHNLSAILHSLKRHTAREINRQLGQTGTPLWQDESFHHAVRSQAQLLKFQTYIRDNPTKARLTTDSFTHGNLPAPQAT